MRRMISNIVYWLERSNRYKHLLGGAVLGVLADGWYGACLLGISVGGALEYKDERYGGKWDWTDLLMTIVGALSGQLIRAVL